MGNDDSRTENRLKREALKQKIIEIEKDIARKNDQLKALKEHLDDSREKWEDYLASR